jgi:DNA-binding CsgD family transcriptional regulator
MDTGVVSMVPLGGPSWSGLGFHRRLGRPPFADHDLCAVHLGVASIDLLHRGGTDVAANTDKLFAFRPRERQVLLYLLAGDQTKQIATKLGISHHTVADYVKVIYRRLGVGTRTELLRLFLPGTSSPAGS